MERIEKIAQSLDLDAFKASFERQWAIERGIEIISEATRHIPSELTAKHPEIPWHDIRGIGNRIRHNYQHVDPQIIWTIATKHVAELKPVIEALLAALPPEPAA